ncbi:MAG TPA: RDD family protein [Acidobacteriaceae bacterium]|nr:RDD family protein [Acidobacteriaceae bacterium]
MNTSQTAEAPEVQIDWKQEVNARLNAHRSRRGAFAQQPPLPGMEASARVPKAAKVAARVAERYAAAPSYREMLAAEAARAAEAAAEAAREAQHAAEAVNEALRAAAEAESASNPQQEAEAFELTPPPAPEPIHYRVDPASLPARPRQSSPSLPQLHPVEPHPHVVDPFEDAVVAPAQPLPARVLEFPRELIAPRKARPRFAEGPLREPGSDAEKEQLRIFECEPEAICHQPVLAVDRADETRLPVWSSIRLDATPRGMEMSAASVESDSAALGEAGQPFSARARRSSRTSGGASSLADMLPLHVAPLGDRLLAAFIDMCLIAIGFFSCLMVFLACTIHPPMGRPALIASSAVFAGFLLLYQWLFFTFAEGTPGMRCAKIALCTFDDENPDRKALRHRIGAACLAVLPLGLGFLWALLDEDHLGWHDRMTRTYQRSYR